MTLTLSHGTWSVTIARPTGQALQTQFILTERTPMDTTYQWNLKGQRLSAVSNCTFSFANHNVPSPFTWKPSLAQRAWEDAASAQAPESLQDVAENNGGQRHLQIELAAQFCWESDLAMGQARANWHAG
ncbi:MAG: hypothetical protein ACRESP_22540 [Pseudomonas sp.]